MAEKNTELTPVQKQTTMFATMHVYTPECVYDKSERGWLGFIRSYKLFEVTYTVAPAGITVKYDAKKWGAPETEGFRFVETTNRTGMRPVIEYDLPNIMTHFTMMQHIHRAFKKPMNTKPERHLLRHWFIDRCEMKELPESEGKGWVFEWYGVKKTQPLGGGGGPEKSTTKKEASS